MEEMAKADKFKRIFLNPADIGGRYSALSYFGIVPAALMGWILRSCWIEWKGLFIPAPRWFQPRTIRVRAWAQSWANVRRPGAINSQLSPTPKSHHLAFG